MSTVASRIKEVVERVSAAAERSGREASDIGIVAVAKKHSAEAIVAAVEAGLFDIGENYVQELVAKRHALADRPVRWHFLGQLQRNKVKDALGCELLHGVDSERLAGAIAKRADAAGIKQKVLVAVNLAGEASKSGVIPGDLPALLEQIQGLDGIICTGLMTLPPRDEESRPWFQKLRKLRDLCASEEQPLPELSMGMSADFETGIEEGATLIRIGTAIFGPREASG